MAKAASKKVAEAKTTSSTTTPAPKPVGKFEKKTGISPETLKAKFTSDSPSEKITALKNLLQARISDGRTKNFRDYRVWAAIDEACDAPFNQITPTLIGKVLSQNLNFADTEKAVASWGLAESDLFSTIDLPDGNKQKVLNPQTFHRVLLPLALSYWKIRVAKLFNDRNQIPLFSYGPSKMTELNRLQGQVITDLVQEMAQNYGYSSVLRSAIGNALKYSMAMMFVSEAWDVQYDTDDEGDEFAAKEGLRYNIPHPSRMFYDMTSRPSTILTNSGMDHGAYWNVVKYGDIQNNTHYWNRDKISYGTNWMDSPGAVNYFKEVYPCAMRFPTMESGSNSRETVAAFYQTGDADKACFLTNMFCWLRPSDWDLGDYKHPIWFRFVLASDSDVIWAEPLPYTPMVWFGYDADEGRARNPSLVLEALPWQDHLGNVLTGILLACKQNNTKIIPYDSDQIEKKDIEGLGMRRRDYTGVHFLGYSSKDARVAQVNPATMFLPVNLGYQNVAEMTNTINTVISIMERLLGMSSAEVGAAGSHIQTAEEVRTINTNTSTRIEYSGSFIDDAIDAWKKQIYQAMQSFMDDEFVSQVSDVDEKGQELLKKLGFVLGETFNGITEVKGLRSKLQLSSFISNRDGQNRVNAPQIAQIIYQSITSLAQSGLIESVGKEEVIKHLNLAAQLLGAPRDYKIAVRGSQAQEIKAIQQQIGDMAKQIQQGAVQQSVQAVKPVAEEVKQQGQAIQQIGQATDETQQALQQVGEMSAQNSQAIQQIGQLVTRLNEIMAGATQPNPQQQQPQY